MKRIISMFLVLSVILCGCSISNVQKDSIPTIYMTDEIMKNNNTMESYAENKEITTSYDHKLAVKCINGTFVGKLEDSIKVWRGIPYAKQPVGELRFKKSEAPEPSDKIYEAYHYGKSCLQPENIPERASMYEQGEDCLTLAIYEYDNEIQNKPVLVYIHGGGWAFGGTVDPLYYGKNFVYYNQNMIVIDITYRLGLMGQINLSELEGYNDDYMTSHNNGLLDQIQALKWIKQNISSFGGDPENITICGESAGGGSVALLVLMASDKDNKYMPHDNLLFKKAISMSGGINQLTTIEDSYKLTNDIKDWFAKEKNIIIKSVTDLQNLSFEQLKEFWNDSSRLTHLNYCVLDGEVLPIDAYGTYKKCVDNTITVLQGATTNEFAYYKLALDASLKNAGLAITDLNKAINILCTSATVVDPGFFTILEFNRAYERYMEALEKEGYHNFDDKMREFANDYTLQGINYYQAEQQAHNGGTTYTYAFNQPYDETQYHMGAAHAVDCFYLFGNFTGEMCEGTDEQVDFSRRFMKCIANFCTNGNPSTSDIEWKPYTVEKKHCAVLDAKHMESVEGYNAERIEFLCEMYDTNEKMRSVPNWANLFSIALGTQSIDVAMNILYETLKTYFIW